MLGPLGGEGVSRLTEAQLRLGWGLGSQQVGRVSACFLILGVIKDQEPARPGDQEGTARLVRVAFLSR